MHAEILQSGKFPEIVFTPTREKGEIAGQGTLWRKSREYSVSAAKIILPRSR